MSRRILSRGALAVVTAVLLSACSFTGPNSYTLPFSKGGGGDAVKITVELENATNLVPNSEVKYQEVTVGSVRKIRLEGWKAVLTVGLEKDAKVPADVTAQVAQKSLLGAEYLELSDPAERAGDELLATGDVIGLERTARYPETEEVLSAASLLLSGGGLPQVRTIAREVNAALSGRTETFNALVGDVSTAAAELDTQRSQIVGALGQLRDLSGALNEQSDVIKAALSSAPPAVDSLAEVEEELADALTSLGEVGLESRTALGQNAEALGQILDDLRPITKAVQDVGPKTHLLLDELTYPFPLNSVDNGGLANQGAANIYANITINAPELVGDFLGVDAVGRVFSGLLGGHPNGTPGDVTDPLLIPLDLLGGDAVGDAVAGALGLEGSRVSPFVDGSGPGGPDAPIIGTDTPTTEQPQRSGGGLLGLVGLLTGGRG